MKQIQKEKISLLKEYIEKSSPKFKGMHEYAVGLLFYAIMIEDFGFDSIAKLNRRFLNINLQTDEDKYDTLVVLYS